MPKDQDKGKGKGHVVKHLGGGPGCDWGWDDEEDDHWWGWGRGRGRGKYCELSHSPPKKRKTGTSLKGKELNQWKVHRMQAALDLYYEHLDQNKNPHTANTNWCTAQFGIPPSTFSHYVSDAPSSRKIKGAEHESKIFKDWGNFSLAYIYISL